MHTAQASACSHARESRNYSCRQFLGYPSSGDEYDTEEEEESEEEEEGAGDVLVGAGRAMSNGPSPSLKSAAPQVQLKPDSRPGSSPAHAWPPTVCSMSPASRKYAQVP